MYWILYLILIITTWGFLDITYHTIRYGVGPVPSSIQALKLACEQIQEQHKIIYDVGGGFAISTRYFAKRFPQKTIVMLEISYFSYLIAKFLCRNISNITIVHGNFLSFSFAKDSFLYVYLYPSLMRKLLHHLIQWEGVVVSYAFSFRNLHEKNRFFISHQSREQLFVYEFKKSM